MWYKTSLFLFPKGTKIMLHVARILPLSQDLASKIGFDRDFEIKEVFVVQWCYNIVQLCIFEHVRSRHVLNER